MFLTSPRMKNLCYAVAVCLLLTQGVAMNHKVHAQASPLQNDPLFISPTPKDIVIGDEPLAEFRHRPLTNTLSDEQATTATLSEITMDTTPKYHKESFVHWQMTTLYKMRGDVVDIKKIDKELRFINRNNKFQLKAELVPNEDGSANLNVFLHEQQPTDIAVTYDNQGRPRNGILRTGVEATQDNIIGIGDQVKGRTVQAEGTEFYELSLNLPTNRRGGRIDGWGTYQQNNTVFDNGVSGNRDENTGWGITLSQPIDKSGLFTAKGGYVHRNVHASSFDPPTSKRTNDNEFDVYWGGLEFNKEYLNDERTKKYGETTLSTYVFGEVLQRNNNDLYRILVNGRQSFNLPHDQTLVFRGTAQQAPVAVFPLQMYPVTGALNVRGYNEGALYGDDVLFGSAEYYFPIPGLKKLSPELNDKIRGVVFTDFANARLDTNRPIVPNTSRTSNIWTAGAGLRVKFSPHVQGFVDAAFGLNTPDNFVGFSSNSSTFGPGSRVHFGIRTTLLDRSVKSTKTLKEQGFIETKRPKFDTSNLTPVTGYSPPNLYINRLN